MKGKDIKKVIMVLKEQYPSLDAVIDAILTPKTETSLTKCKNRAQILSVVTEPGTLLNRDGKKKHSRAIFWCVRDGEQWLPCWRLLHTFPQFLTVITIDAGAPQHLLNGASLMAPGVLQVDSQLSVGSYVAAAVPDAPALCVGRLTQDPKDIMKEGRHDPCLEMLTILGDGFWNMNDEIS